MKVLILAGGFGTRLGEETVVKPKPMIEIGNKPILWHIMKMYSSYGFNDFVILLGYKGYVIKEYFSNYFLHQSDVTIDLEKNKLEVHQHECEPWKVTLLDTGLRTMTGGRIKRAKDYIDNEPFMLTYGDGLSNVDINELVKFHKLNGKKITITAVQPVSRYGVLNIEESGEVSDFLEKPMDDGTWINGGFFVCEPEIMDLITDDLTIFEREPLKQIAESRELVAYKHFSFWYCMDTLRDKTCLVDMWDKQQAPWKVW